MFLELLIINWIWSSNSTFIIILIEKKLRINGIKYYKNTSDSIRINSKDESNYDSNKINNY